jgi:hypothetical protein
MDPTRPAPARREAAQEASGKWATVRYAVRGWGPTARLCVISLVTEAPLLLWAVTRR